MIQKASKNDVRLRKHLRVRKKISGTAECPRLCVFRSNANIYAQIIDDSKGVTLVSASTLDKAYQAAEDADKTAAAKAVGKLLGERASEKGIDTVVFDRSGYIYHGRIAALADGAREAGLQF